MLLRQVLVIEYGTRLFQWCRQSELLPFAAHRAAQEAAVAELGKKLTRAASYKRAMQANRFSLESIFFTRLHLKFDTSTAAVTGAAMPRWLRLALQLLNTPRGSTAALSHVTQSTGMVLHT